MNTPKISIIIPAYQHGSTISACLENIFRQTLVPFEVIIVNDGSTDNTFAAIEPFLGRVKVVNQQHQGASVARNTGFHYSTGAYVLFCDADVVMRRHMLDVLYEALEKHPHASYAYSGFRFGWKRFSSHRFSARKLHHRNFIHTSALIRREHFPGFDPTIHRFQDWDLWLTMLEQGHVGVFVNDQLFRVQTSDVHMGISTWRPSFLYKIPWRFMGWMPSSIRYYDDARKIIAKKHRL